MIASACQLKRMTQGRSVMEKPLRRGLWHRARDILLGIAGDHGASPARPARDFQRPTASRVTKRKRRPYAFELCLARFRRRCDSEESEANPTFASRTGIWS
jgi:hypothetical protein